MKIVGIISTVGVPACYGGYETLVENLLTYKQNEDIKYQVYCSYSSYKEKLPEYKSAKLVYLPLKANGPMGILYDSLSLFHAYLTCDVIMSLGTVGCFWLPLLKLFSSKKIIVNLDGLDDKREKWNKFARLVIGNARNVAAKYSNVIVADNLEIQKYIKKKYNKSSELIEYGGDNAHYYYDERALKKYGLEKRKYAFKVARIEPENKIDVILEAFSKLLEYKMVLVGNWNKSEYGRNTRSKYEKYPNLLLLDPIYNSNEINLLRSNCDIYIHGHSAGGTNPSLVEAMYLSLPIIATDVEYNRATTENQALYFNSSEDLQQVVRNITDETKKSLAEKMKEIADRRYLWKIIACKYESLYR